MNSLSQLLQRAAQSAPPGLSKPEARYHFMLVISLPTGILAHIVFLIIFWWLDYTILAYFNVFSVAAFTYSYFRLFRGDLHTATYLCMLFEIQIHAVLATYYLGFDTGFWLLAFISLLSTIVYPYFSRFVRYAICFALIPIVAATMFFTIPIEPIYDVSYSESFLFFVLNVITLVIVFATILSAYDIAVANAEDALEREFERGEALLHNILPVPIAKRLKEQEDPLADKFESVTVLFTDIAGFTNMSRGMAADELVGILNELFTEFDALVTQHGAEKIKTIGDAYMIATGLDGGKDHADQMARLAQDMHRAFEAFRKKHDLDLGLRTGLHSGEAVAGVIGKRKFAYDLWGDTVNVASRMESSGEADHIQITSQTRDLLSNTFTVELRGKIDIKGHAARETYYLR
ncbi:MAG: adenylate cyclase [Paracoccaceae bacterium]